MSYSGLVFPPGTLTDGATINWNAQTIQSASVTIAGNRTLANPTNLINGKQYFLRVTQDATGNRRLVFGTAYKFGLTGSQISPFKNQTTIFTFMSDGTNLYATNVQYGMAEIPNNTHSLDLTAASSQYASRSNASQVNLGFSRSFTIESWVNLKTLPASGSDYAIMSKYFTTGNQRSYGFTVRNNGGTMQLRCLLSTDGTTVDDINVNQAVSTSTWYHFAVSFDAFFSRYNFYTNGQQIGTATGTRTSILQSTAEVQIGALNSGTFMNGYLDEVRAWSLVRTPQQILENYNQSINPNQTGLEGYWRFNNAATDGTQNANTLTLNGGATYNSLVPF